MWRKRALIRSDVQERVVRQNAILAPDRQASTGLARSAGIIDESVAFDSDRIRRLYHFDRHVRLIGADMRNPFLPVIVAARAPSPHRRLAKNKLLAILHTRDRRQCGTARPVCSNAVRHRLRQRAKQAVDHPVAGDAPRAARPWRNGANDRPFRRAHVDDLRKAVTVRNVGRHHGTQRGVGACLGERKGRIHAAGDLRRRAGPVDDDVSIADRDGDLQDDRLRRVADPVDMVGETIGPIRDIG